MMRAKKITAAAVIAILIASGTVFFVLRNVPEQAPVTVGLNVYGMYGAACVVTVRASLAGVPGVRRVRVDAARARATVSLVDSTTGVEELIRAVKESGFTAEAADIPSSAR